MYIREIGSPIDLLDCHYETLWATLPLDADARVLALSLRCGDKKFAVLWAYLPLEDNLIARLLEVKRQKVINLRASARELLARRLKDIL